MSLVLLRARTKNHSQVSFHKNRDFCSAFFAFKRQLNRSSSVLMCAHSSQSNDLKLPCTLYHPTTKQTHYSSSKDKTQINISTSRPKDQPPHWFKGSSSITTQPSHKSTGRLCQGDQQSSLTQEFWHRAQMFALKAIFARRTIVAQFKNRPNENSIELNRRCNSTTNQFIRAPKHF